MEEPLESGAVIEQRDSTRFGGVGDGDLPDRYSDKTWKQAARAYRRHRIGEDANESYGNTLHGRAERKYAQCLDLDRSTRVDLKERHVALVSLRISPTYHRGYLRPLDQIDLLQNAWSACKNDLPSGEYIKLIAGTGTFGTAHIHCVHFSEGYTSIEDFRPLCERFVDQCRVLDSLRGNVPSQGAVVVRSDEEIDYGQYQGDGVPVAPCTTYVARQIPHIKPAGECTEGDLFFGAAINASPKRPFYLSRRVPRNTGYRQPVGSANLTSDSDNSFTPEQEILAD